MVCLFYKHVISCSFHVGSGAQSADAYAQALASVKQVFIAAVSFDICVLKWKRSSFL